MPTVRPNAMPLGLFSIRNRCFMRKPRPTGMLPQLKRYCIVVAGICSEPSFETKVHGTQQATQKTQHQNQRALNACGSTNALPPWIVVLGVYNTILRRDDTGMIYT